jgi:hypothetical protein
MLRRFLRRLLVEEPLPVGVGLALVSWQQYHHIQRREREFIRRHAHDSPEALIIGDFHVVSHGLLVISDLHSEH